MNQSRLQYSLPGEWIDRRGEARMKSAIRRIIVIKPDHIGDLLISSKAFSLLRHFFPNAEIDLVCGPWNVQLAQKMGVFDHVYGVNLFHEVSGQQRYLEVAQAAKKKGIDTLVDLCLGPYDIAMDLRYDPDSRPILPTIDARIYVGFGSSLEFPFLDILLPPEIGSSNEHASYEVVLGGQSFHRTSGIFNVMGWPSSGSGTISAQKTDIEVEFIVKGAKSPAECGTVANDRRLLGIALQNVALSPANAKKIAKNSWPSQSLAPSDKSLSLISSWDSLEDWGVWGVGPNCRIRVALPNAQSENEVRVDIELLAHVNPANPIVECTVRCGDIESTIVCEHPQATGLVSLFVPRYDQTVSLVSVPFQLATGYYKGMLRLYLPLPIETGTLELKMRGVETHATFLRRAIGSQELNQGICDVNFECDVCTTNEMLYLQIEAQNAKCFEGARVELFTLAFLTKQKIEIPKAHMEQRACMLVLRTAMEFSTEAPFQNDAIADRLIAPPDKVLPGGPLEILTRHIKDWKDSGGCVIGIGLGVNSEIRKWPFHFYVEMLRSLMRMGPVFPLFIGSPSDAPESFEACALLGLDPDLHSSCGKVPLSDLGRHLKTFDIFVSNNTGTTHFAGRIGVRTLGIYSGTNHPREWGPVGQNTSWIYRDESCAPCFLSDIKDCRFGYICMKNLLPNDVLALLGPEVAAVLSRRQRMS